MKLFNTPGGSWTLAFIATSVSAIISLALCFFSTFIAIDLGFSLASVGPIFILTIIGMRFVNLSMRGKDKTVDDIYGRRGYSVATGNALGVFIGSLVYIGVLWAFAAMVTSFVFDRKK